MVVDRLKELNTGVAQAKETDQSHPDRSVDQVSQALKLAVEQAFIPSYISSAPMQVELAEVYSDLGAPAAFAATRYQTKIDAEMFQAPGVRYSEITVSFNTNDSNVFRIDLCGAKRIGFLKVFPQDEELIRQIDSINTNAVYNIVDGQLIVDCSSLPSGVYDLQLQVLVDDVSRNNASSVDHTKFERVLVLGSGHGRETALFRAVNPKADIVAVDIVSEYAGIADQYLASLDRLNGVLASHAERGSMLFYTADLFTDEVGGGEQFDFIFGLQRFLMHCKSEKHLKDFIDKLSTMLTEDGVLMFDLPSLESGYYGVLNQRTKDAIRVPRLKAIYREKIIASSGEDFAFGDAELEVNASGLVYDIPGNASKFPLDLGSGGENMPGYTRLVFDSQVLIDNFVSASFEVDNVCSRTIPFEKSDWLGVNSIGTVEEKNLLSSLLYRIFVDQKSFNSSELLLLKRYSQLVNRAIRLKHSSELAVEELAGFLDSEFYTVSADTVANLSYVNLYYTFRRV